MNYQLSALIDRFFCGLLRESRAGAATEPDSTCPSRTWTRSTSAPCSSSMWWPRWGGHPIGPWRARVPIVFGKLTVELQGTVALSANLPGTVGVRASAVSERGCWGEASPSHPIHPALRFGIRRVPVPAGGHPDRRALVPTLRIVLPGSGGAAR